MWIRVAILEDHEPWRKTLETLLGGTPGFRCVCARGTAEELIAQVAVTRPEVVLVDLELPGTSGTECIRRLKTEYPGLGLLVITNFADTDHIFRALRAGASGYVLKRTPPGQDSRSHPGSPRRRRSHEPPDRPAGPGIIARSGGGPGAAGRKAH